MAPRFKFGKNKKKEDEANVSMTSTDMYSRASTTSSKPQNTKDLNIKHNSGQYSSAGRFQPAGNTVGVSSVPVEGVSPWRRHKLLDSPFPRYRHAAASISSERNEIFIMGGLKEGSVFGDTWKIVPNEKANGTIDGYRALSVEVVNLNNPPARVGHSAVLCGNAFIVYGGDTVDTDFNGLPDNNFYLFNINNNKYTIPSHILNKPNGRYGHSIGAISLNNTTSRLYLFGGQLENDVYSDMYYFELNTFKSPKARWEVVEPVNNFKPPPLTNHSMAIDKTTIYIFGGVYNNEKVSNDVWAFDAITNKWTQLPTTGNVPLPVNEHSSCIANDKLFVYGGNDFSGIIYNALYVLDLKTNVWSKLSDNGLINGPGPRCGHSMTFLPKFNRIVIMGGDKNDYVSNDPNDFETYEEYAEEIGTMVFELDLNAIRPFLDDSPLNLSKVAARKLAASASTVPKNNNIADDNLRHNRNLSSGIEEFRTPNGSPERKYDNRFSSQDKFGSQDKLAFQEKNSSQDRFSSQDKFVEVDVPSASLLEDNYDTTKDHVNGIRQNAPKLSEQPLDEVEGIPVSNDEAELIDSDVVKEKTVPVDLSSNGKEEDSKAKQFVTELSNELNFLKASTKAQMQNATEVINKLRQENTSLKEENEKEKGLMAMQLNEQNTLIRELRNTVDPDTLRINDDSEDSETSELETGENTTPISNLSKYKIEVLELNNRLLYLEQENSSLNHKIGKFQPFMNNQIADLSNFEKIIKSQEGKISKLSQQVKDQEVLSKENNDWKSKYEKLELEFNNYKAINSDDEFSDEEERELPIEDNDYINTSTVGSNNGKKSRKVISSHLENLVKLWTSTNEEVEARDKEAASFSKENDDNVAKLQKQIDDLLRVSKQNEMNASKEVESLNKELSLKISSLKTFENNYRDALQSVNNTSKALKLNQDELNAQKITIEKLVNENNELRLFKKANRRISSRNSFLTTGESSPVHGDNIAKNKGSEHNDNNYDDDDDDDGLTSAHFSMKVKDLEADVFVLKQERDQLKDTVTSLQKQLYLAQNSN